MQINKEKLLKWMKEEYEALRSECERDMAAGVFRVQFEIESGKFDIKEDARTPLLNLKKEWELELDKPFDPNFPAYRQIVIGTIQGIDESATALGLSLVDEREDTDHADK